MNTTSLTDIINDSTPLPLPKKPKPKPGPKPTYKAEPKPKPQFKAASVKLTRTAIVGNKTTGQVFDVDGGTRLNELGKVETIKSPFHVEIDSGEDMLVISLALDPRHKTIVPFSNVDWIKLSV